MRRQTQMAEYTRFGIGGPADLFAETSCEQAFIEAVRVLRAAGTPFVVIGGGTNLIVSDAGFRGAVLRYTADEMESDGAAVRAAAGATLDGLVNFAVSRGLAGLETLAGIPGWLGGAVYGNAGAYGHAIGERVRAVRYFDGANVCNIDNAGCGFTYRESAFKRRGDWIILSAEFTLAPTDAAALGTFLKLGFQPAGEGGVWRRD